MKALILATCVNSYSRLAASTAYLIGSNGSSPNVDGGSGPPVAAPEAAASGGVGVVPKTALYAAEPKPV